MENRLKTRISRAFCSSLNACRAKNLLDVIENAVLIPDDRPPVRHLPPVDNCNGLPSMCKPRYCDKDAANFGMINSSIIPRSRLYSFPDDEMAETSIPSSSRISSAEGSSYKRSKKKKRERTSRRERKASALSRSCSQDSTYYYNWFSSEDDEEEEDEHLADEGEDSNSMLFSSRSNTLSSDSSAVTAHKGRKGSSKSESSISSNCAQRNGHVNAKNPQTSMKDSFAVVKASKDPYNDFRTSMVEMIIEKQIFKAEELEHLLQCFLFLNSEHHHKIIVDVFTEIWKALFSS